jgi:DNA mismatch repair protein MutH
MQVKNKVKQNLKQSKGCACETPLAEVFFFPVNGARKIVLMQRGVDSFSPSSWKPQEEGMMSTAASFPSVRNQGLLV